MRGSAGESDSARMVGADDGAQPRHETHRISAVPGPRPNRVLGYQIGSTLPWP